MADEQTVKPDKSLTKAFKEAEQWLAHSDGEGLLDYLLGKVSAAMGEAGPLRKSVQLALADIGDYYANRACVAFGKENVQAVATALPNAVAYRSLAFRFGAIDLPDGTPRVRMPRFETSMKAIGPAMVSDWQTMAINAQLFIAYAEAEMAHNVESELVHGWGKGTVDAFVISLLSQALDVPTTYRPVNPLVQELQALLDHWRSNDKGAFQQAMAQAIQFHIARSKHHTNKVRYEFSAFFEWVFPAELLAVQALRQRDGLPAFDAGHALVDAPWAMIRELPEAEPDPLLLQVEARLKSDYPQFL